MSESLKIAVIGDYNFTYNSHQATNLSLDHAADFLELELNYYWLRPNEAIQQKPIYFEGFDGFVFAPGPFQNVFYLNGILRTIIQLKSPTLVTGESFKGFIEVLIQLYNLHNSGEKLISDNLVSGNSFEKITIVPESKDYIQLYDNFSNIELSSSRYSLYPQLISSLKNEIIEIEAWNQFEEPEIVSLQRHPFFVACSFCPQISSTREIPHPLIYTLLKSILLKKNNILA
jgi:CTP synthase (UTP-ammonia lyase)